MKVVIIKIRDKDGGDIVAVDEIRIPVATDELVAELKVVDAPPRARRAERNPLHPNALTIADLRVGMKIRVMYVGRLTRVRDYDAVVIGKHFKDKYGDVRVPLIAEGLGYRLGCASDMGLMKSRITGRWNRSWYTVTAK